MFRRLRFRIAGVLLRLAIEIMPHGLVRASLEMALNEWEEDVSAEIARMH